VQPAPEIATEETEGSKEGSCSESDSPEVPLVANANEGEPTDIFLTVTEMTDTICSLVSITDDQEFADKFEQFGYAVVDLFSTSLQMDIVLPNIEEFVNLVRKGVFESKAVGQGMTLCCTHIYLMYVHFFHCKEIRDKLNAGTSGDIFKYLAKEYQFMILKGKECYRTVMNILNYGKKFEVTMPMIDEIFKLVNESMPNQKLVVPRSDTSDIPDCDDFDSESISGMKLEKLSACCKNYKTIQKVQS